MKNLILFSILVLGLFACGGGDEDLLPINQEVDVVLSLWQTLPVEPDNLQLLVTNADPIDCTNAEMLYGFSELESDDNTVDIPLGYLLDIQGFSRPDNCVTGDGFVTTSIDFSDGAADRFLNINNKGLSSEGKIRISERAMEISFLEENNFIVEESTINRIPSGLVWGYIDSTPDQSTDINQLLQLEFPDAIIDSAFSDLLGGYYGHFTLGMDPTFDRLVLTEVAGETELEQTVLFRLAPDRWSDLSDILIETAEKFQGFHYAIYNSEGFVLRG